MLTARDYAAIALALCEAGLLLIAVLLWRYR
jgi:hypothetical protein